MNTDPNLKPDSFPRWVLISCKEVPKDWDKVVAYYYQHYTHIIERLFEENGHPINILVEQRTSEPVDQKV